MHISQFDYTLPKELIAQSPSDPRDHSNLMIVDRSTGSTKTDKFFNLPTYLTPNDILVFNNTKVFPARIFGTQNTKRYEVLLLSPTHNSQPTTNNSPHSHSNIWSCLIRGKIRIGDKLGFKKFHGTIIQKNDGNYSIEFNISYPEFMARLSEIGHTPIPPYIKSSLSENELREKYQTIYAINTGSAAAPTAGLHFTNSLLAKLKAKDIQIEYVTLHVGLGTFAPVREENLEEHKIHSEYFTVDDETIDRLNDAKKAGKRIIAVGTTTTRVLETLATNNLDQLGQLEITNSQSSTELFITPGYKFKFVDGLITNFHLPKSTLLALVAAFASRPNTNEIFTTFNNSLIGTVYAKAIEEKFRFFSFGDGMLIL